MAHSFMVSCSQFYILGTFQAETDEEIAYGLVHPLASWDPIYTQVRTTIVAALAGSLKLQSNLYITVTLGKWPGDRYIQGDCRFPLNSSGSQ